MAREMGVYVIDRIMQKRLIAFKGLQTENREHEETRK